ncbi:hypothetical protein [Lewinella cohaerens]|uniref:hypothetical protein n=1 Tax=Lewinella cohaerens TaxID=70995 RepID=UPI00037364AC|nr:hypothetical protein [Lewinella cohaerens]
MKSILTLMISIGISCCFGCHSKEPDTNTTRTLEQEKSTSILGLADSNLLGVRELRYISIIHDSINKQERGKVEKLILDSVLIHDYFSEDVGTYPDSTYEDKLLSVHRIDDALFLVLIEYRSLFGPFGLCGQVVFIDINSYIVVNKTMIEGGKYHAPEITWSDVDKDGQKEIVSRLVYPTSSVPVIEIFETIFEVQEDTFELIEALSTTIETINCVDNTKNTPLIQRSYYFENSLRIKTTERYYSFNCGENWKNFDSSKTLIGEKVFFSTRQSESGVFN